MNVSAAVLLLIALCAVMGRGWADDADPPDNPGDKTPPGPITVPPPAPTGFSRWFNPATAPFIPVPEIAVDPDSGTTLGLIPTWVKTDENHQVRQIIAPDFIHNPYFGYGVHGRIFDYSSGDEQWSAVAGVKERVEREFDGEYQLGRQRQEFWSLNISLIFDRSGTSRFYGLGNNSHTSAQTNYTDERELAQSQVGFNFNHVWQLQYTARFQVLDVLPGTLPDLPSTAAVFPDLVGLHTNKEFLNRLALVYDTRDDTTVPTQGMKLVAYGGASSREGLFNDSSYSEVGVDGRAFVPLNAETIFAAHSSLRYMGGEQIPFWALSNLGGGESDIGGQQQLRSFGAGRYYDKNAFSATVELRRKVYTFNAVTTDLDIEVAPFIDVGRVFKQTSTLPFDHVHQAYGVGFRGIARPFVVGYVDIGVGSDGAAVFTGLNYPF